MLQVVSVGTLFAPSASADFSRVAFHRYLYMTHTHTLTVILDRSPSHATQRMEATCIGALLNAHLIIEHYITVAHVTVIQGSYQCVYSKETPH